MSTRTRMFGVLATTMIVVAACSGGGGTTPAPSAAAPSAAAADRPPHPRPRRSPRRAAAGPVEFDWWHITTGDPGKADFQAIADAYTAAHPNVKINITVLENEAFKTKLATRSRPATCPTCSSPGAAAPWPSRPTPALLKDITADVAAWKDTINPGAMSIYQYNGKQYGIPWDMGMIGFWYNKELFEQAGITAPPTTWDEFLAAVDKLKDAGITPLAIAGKDKWPSMHLWTYLVLRIGGAEALQQMVQTGDWNTDACTKAGRGRRGAERPRARTRTATSAATYNAGGGSGRQRQGRHGADGPVGAGGPEGQERRQEGPRRRSRLVPLPGGHRRRGRRHRRRRRRQRHRRRQGRAARGGRLPQVLQRASTTRTSSTPTASASRRPSGTEVTSPTRTSRPSSTAAARPQFIQLYLDQATSADLGAAFNEATMALFAGQSDPGEGVPGHHRRGGDAVTSELRHRP